MSDRTGILADTVTVSCIGCDCVLIVPARIAADARCYSCLEAQTDAEARAAVEKVKRGTDKATNKGGDGRRRG